MGECEGVGGLLTPPLKIWHYLAETHIKNTREILDLLVAHMKLEKSRNKQASSFAEKEPIYKLTQSRTTHSTTNI
jgi:hypothetical protein